MCANPCKKHRNDFCNFRALMKTFKNMIRSAVTLCAGVFASAFLVSCAPQAFTMNLEMRYPSKAGVDLAGKSISVVYLDDLSGKDSVFCEHLSNSFSLALEKEYFHGNSIIDIYRMEKDMGGDYISKDTLRKLVMDTGKDIVFLFDSPEFGKPKFSEPQSTALSAQDSVSKVYATFPISVRLFVYDSMDKSDSVKVFKGTTTAREAVFTAQNASEEEMERNLWKSMKTVGSRTGKRSAENFLSTWKSEAYNLIYYDVPEAWAKAAQAAYEYRWQDAITRWMSLLETQNIEKRSYAAYNIAVACYILGDLDLSLEWLEKANKDNQTSLTDSLRRKIAERKK